MKFKSISQERALQLQSTLSIFPWLSRGGLRLITQQNRIFLMAARHETQLSTSRITPPLSAVTHSTFCYWVFYSQEAKKMT